MNCIMCNECKRCDGDLCTYFDNYSDRENTFACILFEPKKPTVFDRITQSPEVLAPKFVYRTWSALKADFVWHSTILEGKTSNDFVTFKTEAKAIAATVAKLKEVEK